MARLFGTDGVRGVANKELTCETAFKLGQAAVAFQGKTILIGKDTRLSGDMLESAVASGIMSMGGTALLAGIIPTPAIAWQGYEIHDGRMYLMEGTSGNNDGTTGEAYMTVYDFEGRIVQSRTKVRAVSDLKALTEAGITESGYIESEGVKIRRGKLFLGFASQSKKDGNRRRANIFQYELP